MRGMVWVVLAAFALILCIGIFCGAYSSRISEEMQARVSTVASLAEEADTAQALARTRDLMGDWEKRSGLITMWVNHEDVDEVSLGLERLLVALEAEEPFFARLYLAQLQEALSHIYHRDAFQLKNIL